MFKHTHMTARFESHQNAKPTLGWCAAATSSIFQWGPGWKNSVQLVKITSDNSNVTVVYGCLWMFMDVHGCSWMFMDVYGCLWCLELLFQPTERYRQRSRWIDESIGPSPAKATFCSPSPGNIAAASMVYLPVSHNGWISHWSWTLYEMISHSYIHIYIYMCHELSIDILRKSFFCCSRFTLHQKKIPDIVHNQF